MAEEHRLRRVLWTYAHLSNGFVSGFVLLWLVSGLGYFLALAYSLRDVGAAFSTAAVLGEITGGVIMVPAERLTRRPWFVATAFRRILRSKNLVTLSERVPVALRYGKRFLRRRVGWGNFAPFMLAPISDSSLPTNERPSTFAASERTIVVDLIEKASHDKPPWKTVAPEVDSLANAVGGDTPDGALRDAVWNLFAQANPWYRQRFVAPRLGFISRFFEAYPWIPVVAQAIVAAIILGAGLLSALRQR